MRIFLLLLFFISSSAGAEIVKATGTYKHMGDKTKNESCKIALEKAKKNAIMKSLGETVTSEIVSSCSEVDGEFNCERNQFSLLSLKGDIVDIKKVIKIKILQQLGKNLKSVKVKLFLANLIFSLILEFIKVILSS